MHLKQMYPEKADQIAQMRFPQFVHFEPLLCTSNESLSATTALLAVNRFASIMVNTV